MRTTRRAVARACRVLALSGLFVSVLAGAASARQTYVLIVVGVPGDDEHAKKFQKWAATFVDAAKAKDAVPDANITLLTERQASREGVERAVASIAARAKPTDDVVILLVGHGSFDGRQAAFNLPGPDLTSTDWARLLDTLTAAHVSFINTSSASGAFLPTVASPGRIVITATKTGGERNETEFPEYFVGAFADEAADRDRNGRVSMAEAFEYARTRVVQAFQQKGLLLTEHATMDDGGSGQLAATVFLGADQTAAALQIDMSDPALRALAAERDALEQQVAALKLKKTSTDAAEYDARMEQLLTDLALKTKAIRDRQAKGGTP